MSNNFLSVQKKLKKDLDHLNEINKLVDNDKFIETTEDIGKLFVHAFPGNQGMSQMRALENIAYGSGKISDILNYIKGQVGKSRTPDKEWRYPGLGEKLLQKLEEITINRLKDKEKKGADAEKMEEERIFCIELARQFIKQISRHFIFLKAINKTGEHYDKK